MVIFLSILQGIPHVGGFSLIQIDISVAVIIVAEQFKDNIVSGPALFAMLRLRSQFVDTIAWAFDTPVWVSSWQIGWGLWLGPIIYCSAASLMCHSG